MLKISGLLILMFFIFSGCKPEADEPSRSPNLGLNGEPIEAGTKEVYIFAAGRADAVLITTEYHTVLIDTGERVHGQGIVSHLQERGINEIDYLIITHFDGDHVGGAHLVVSSMDVNNVIIPDYTRDSSNVQRFFNALELKGIEPHVLTETIRFTLDDAAFMLNPTLLSDHDLQNREIINGDEDDDDDDDEVTDDDYSIVVSVTHGENSFLYTGDAAALRLGELLENEEIMNTDYTFLKAPRHGRRNALSLRFIRTISPQYAVITGFHPDYQRKYSPDGQERPAHWRIISQYEEVGAQVFFTMSESAHVICNGKELTVSGYSPVIEDTPRILGLNGRPITAGTKEVYIFGIGRADAILITTQYHTVLIDAGGRAHGNDVVNHLQSRDINKIDYFIITHYDSDHFGGAAAVVNELDIQNVIVPDYTRESNHLSRLNNALEQKEITPQTLTETLRFTLDDTEFMLNPTQLSGEIVSDGDDDDDDDSAMSNGDFSIVVSVTHGENNFLYTGGAAEMRLQELLMNDEIMNTDYTFLKVPRHGRRDNSSVVFIRAINPNYAVITGFHPDDEGLYASERPTHRRIVSALVEDSGAEIFFTMDRSAHIVSDGTELTVSYH
jgi:beta-lactamase superfamily II metal-dependent hydrolase